ncbi:MAG: hypothetical protein EOM87_10340 [Clostridia bacterium]|nr:hypothetical protein [Clostridia bacterium]
MNNLDVKLEAAGAGIKLWQIADKLGITDSSFSRILRRELSPEYKQKIRHIIAEMKGSEKHAADSNNSRSL